LLTSHFLLSPLPFINLIVCVVYHTIHIVSIKSGLQKGKVQFVPFYFVKTYTGSGGIAPLILTLGNGGRCEQLWLWSLYLGIEFRSGRF